MNLLDPRLWLAFIIWTGLIAGGAYWKGNSSGKNSVLIGTLTATNKAITKRSNENAELAQKYADYAQKASDEHAKELDAIKRAAASNAGKRVPISADFCRPAGAPESATTGSDGQGNAATAFLPDRFASDLRQLVEKADEVTADLRTLKRRADEAGCFQ